jgi:hypothetical protein
MARPRELRDYLLVVCDGSYGSQGKETEMRAHEKGLRIRVTYAAYAGVALQHGKVGLEPRAKGRVFYGVYLARKASSAFAHHHTRTTRPQMRVVIHSKKHVKRHVSL